MSESWSSQEGDDPNDIGNWMAWRKAQLDLSPEADALARDLWDQGTWGGIDVQAFNPSDLTALGRAALNGVGPYSIGNDDDPGGGDVVNPPASSGANLGYRGSNPSPGSGSDQESPDSGNAAPGPPANANNPWVSEVEVVGRPPGQASQPGFWDRLNHDPIARGAAGFTGFLGGLIAGVPRTGLHAIEGVGAAGKFALSLLNSQGRAEAWKGGMTAEHNALQYGRSVMDNPLRLKGDILSAAQSANHSLNPFATPFPDTATGVFGHELGIGMNAGETLTNIAGLAGGLELAEGLNAIRGFEAAQPARVAKYMAQGFDGPTATYLSKRYVGLGDHAGIPRRQKSIFGATIPDWIMDSPFNVSRPRGLSQGDFYEYHYGVDPHFYGAKLPQNLNSGRGWSGKRLGLERYSGAGRLWARIPSIWKDATFSLVPGDALEHFAQGSSEVPQ